MHLTLFQIMAVLAGGPADAAGVLDALRGLGDDVPSVPAFYRHLRQGIDEGWIAVEGTGPAEGPGRPAQTYGLTPGGRSALRERGRELERFTRLALGRGGAGGGEA